MKLLDDNQDQPAIDPEKNYLEELVGDGKKFKSPEELARGKYQSDLYIKELERQKDELRSDFLAASADAKSKANLEELVTRLTKNQGDNQPPVDNVQKPSVELKDIESLVSNKLQEYQTTTKQLENFNFVKDKLTERYGSNYNSALKQQMDELDLTVDELENLARTKPKFLIKTLGLDKEPTLDTFQAPPHSSQRNSNFAPTTKKRTWSYYENLRRTDPKVYHDPKTSVQMYNDVVTLGESVFYDTQDTKRR